MTPEVRDRIEQIRHGNVPEGYKKTEAGIIPNEWRVGQVSECIEEYKSLSNDIAHIPVYSSSRKGLMPQSDYYDQREAVETNLGYKVVPQGYVTYRHMSDDDVFHFNINRTGGDILVSSEYPVFTASENCDLRFLIPALNSTARFRYFCKTQKLGGTRTRLYLENLKKYALALPPYSEQIRIAEILTVQDKVIELKEKRLAEKRRQKKHLMQQLLTGKKRLPGFDGKWKFVELGKIAKKERAKNRSFIYSLVLSNSAQHGIIPQTDQFDKEIASEDRIDGYYIVHDGFFVYNPRISVTAPCGPINRNETGTTGVMSPLYTVFSIEAKMMNTDFLKQYFSSSCWYKHMKSVANYGARHDRMSVSDDGFFLMPIPVPTQEEQTAIADMLMAADKEIDLLLCDLEQEKQKKKALMQLLLTGIVRV